MHFTNVPSSYLVAYEEHLIRLVGPGLACHIIFVNSGVYNRETTLNCGQMSASGIWTLAGKMTLFRFPEKVFVL